MLKIKAQIVLDENKKQRGVLLKPRDFERLIEILEDYDDYKEINKRLAVKDKVYYSDEYVKQMLSGKDA